MYSLIIGRMMSRSVTPLPQKIGTRYLMATSRSVPPPTDSLTSIEESNVIPASAPLYATRRPSLHSTTSSVDCRVKGPHAAVHLYRAPMPRSSEVTTNPPLYPCTYRGKFEGAVIKSHTADVSAFKRICFAATPILYLFY